MKAPMTQNTLLSQARSVGAVICTVESDVPIKRRSSGSKGGRKKTKYSPMPIRTSPHRANIAEEYVRCFMVFSASKYMSLQIGLDQGSLACCRLRNGGDVLYLHAWNDGSLLRQCLLQGVCEHLIIKLVARAT